MKWAGQIKCYVVLSIGYEIRKHVHNNRGIIQAVIRISGRNEFITPSSIQNCKDANFFFLRTRIVKNKILYAPRRHRMITPIERYPSLGLKPSSWIHRSPGVIIVVTPLVHK
jgi:hypothetical protein